MGVVPLSVFDPLAVNDSPPTVTTLPNESMAVIVKLADTPTVAMVNALPLTLDNVRHTGPGTTKKFGIGG